MDLQLIHTVQSVIGVALLASGVLLFVVAAVGMVRFGETSAGDHVAVAHHTYWWICAEPGQLPFRGTAAGALAV